MHVISVVVDVGEDMGFIEGDQRLFAGIFGSPIYVGRMHVL
jgi:hypothetical protein